jgi:predicted Zn finger-like uncharacterized protein
MIIKCEKCQSEFNLDERLLKKDGSTVRCSVCKHTFKVFLQEPEVIGEPETDDDFSNTAMEETVALDLPPDQEDIDHEMEEDKQYSFDRAFENAMQEVIEDEDLIIPDNDLDTDEKEDTSELSNKKPAPAAQNKNGIKKKAKGKPGILLISLLIVLILIVTFLVIFFFFPAILPESLYSTPSKTSETQSDAGVSKLGIEGVTGSFFTADIAGHLYIIKGSVINNDLKPISYILLKGAILDEKGNPIKQDTAYAGNALTDTQLKEMTWENINKNMKNRAGTDNSNIEIKTGSSIPFMIIFKDLPDSANELSVEAISSSYQK